MQNVKSRAVVRHRPFFMALTRISFSGKIKQIGEKTKN